MKFKIHKRRGLSLRKPWELIYPSQATLKFKTFTEALTQVKMLFLLEKADGAKQEPAYIKRYLV